MVPYHSFGKFYQIAVHFVNGILPDWKPWDIKPWTGDRRFVKDCWKDIAKISAVPDCFSGSVLPKLFSPSFTMWLLIHEHISKEWPWRPFKQRLVVARNSEARSKEPFGWIEHDGMSGRRVVSRVVGCSRWFLPLMLRKCTSDTPPFYPMVSCEDFPFQSIEFGKRLRMWGLNGHRCNIATEGCHDAVGKMWWHHQTDGKEHALDRNRTWYPKMSSEFWGCSEISKGS